MFSKQNISRFSHGVGVSGPYKEEKGSQFIGNIALFLIQMGELQGYQ